MKNLIWILAALLVLAACSKEEPAAPVSEDVAAVESEAADAVADTTESAEASAEETLEVVEESAAEATPEDETIVLALADTEVPAREWKFREGEHYTRMVPTQPTVGGVGTIRV